MGRSEIEDDRVVILTPLPRDKLNRVNVLLYQCSQHGPSVGMVGGSLSDGRI